MILILPLLLLSFSNLVLSIEMLHDEYEKNNSIVEEIKEIMYTLDYDSFLHKIEKKDDLKRRTRFTDHIDVESIEIKFNWESILSGERLGSAFLLKKGERYIENALLYPPKDGVFTVRGLMDASGYIGEVKIIRDQQNLDDSGISNQDSTLTFKIDTPRIVSGNEAIAVLKALNRIPESEVKMETVSVSLKLQERPTNNLYLQVLRVSSNSSSPRALVHIIPDTTTVVVNDLPAHSLMKLTLKAYNITKKPVELFSVLLFTGSLYVLNNSPPQSLSSRAAPLNKKGVREAVTCYVANKAPFQGFPCKGSETCIPLHWECDGEYDCKDGYDESNCKAGDGSANIQKTFTNSQAKCRRNEFQCLSGEIPVCLPVSWMCDGRTDCSDGWDEDKANCDYTSYRPEYEHYYPVMKCRRNYYRCRRGGCVPHTRVCDGRRDCPDGSDELNCSDEDNSFEYEESYLCDEEFEFHCFRSQGSRKCVPRPWLCDGQSDCPAGEDEDYKKCNTRVPEYNIYD